MMIKHTKTYEHSSHTKKCKLKDNYEEEKCILNISLSSYKKITNFLVFISTKLISHPGKMLWGSLNLSKSSTLPEHSPVEMEVNEENLSRDPA